LEHETWKKEEYEHTGGMIWEDKEEGGTVYTFSRALARLGISQWKDVLNKEKRDWYTWDEIKDKYGASTAHEEKVYNQLTAHLDAMQRAVEWKQSDSANDRTRMTKHEIEKINNGNDKGEYIASREIPKCLGGWEYLVEWQDGSKTWEPECTFGEETEEQEKRGKKRKTSGSQMKGDKIQLREHYRRPKDLREILERRAELMGSEGTEWLRRIEKGDATDRQTNIAIEEAMEVYLQYAHQT